MAIPFSKHFAQAGFDSDVVQLMSSAHAKACKMLHDTGGLRQVCGASPFDLDRGVAQTVAWMRGGQAPLVGR